MKLVLLGINARYTHTNFALRYLREMTEGLPVETALLEFSINTPVFDIMEAVRREKPAVAALSVYIWNAEAVEKMIPLIAHTNPGIKIILGGPEVSYNAQAWISRFPQIDCIICGAGEAAFRQLAENGFTALHKIVLKENIPFADIPFPYRSGFDGMENRYMYYESSRGCPFSCAYCLSSRCDQTLEQKPLDAVFAELDALCAQNPQLIKFVDRSFNADPARARAIWNYFIEKKYPGRIHCELHPLLLENEDFHMLEKARAGIFQFEIGVQSTHEKSLEAVGRPVRWDEVKENIRRLCSMKNVHTHLDLIAGLPFDTLENFAASVDNVLEMHPDHFQPGFLKALHGTAIRGNAAAYDLFFEPFAPYEIISNKWLSADDCALLRRIEQLIETTYNPHYFDDLIYANVSAYGGWFTFYKKLSSYCTEAGFDIATKNETKLRALLNQFSFDGQLDN